MPTFDTITAPADLGYTSHGGGAAPVLVLHDWNGDHTNWDAILPYLDGETFTWVFADLRGYGLSRAIAGRHTAAEIAGDCLRLADRLGWGRFRLIGHSMTGVAVERLCVDAPERIAGAVVVCAVSAAGTRFDPGTKDFFRRTIDDDEAFRRLIRFVSGGLGEGWVAAKLRQNRACVDPACRADYLEMFAGADFADAVAGSAVPLLAVVGDHDPGLDRAAMERTFLTHHGVAEVVELQACGHYPMQECPPRFVAVVEAFLRRHVE